MSDMKIFINDKEFQFDRSVTLAEALAGCGVELKGIAVAVNDKVVAQSAHDSTALSDGDRIIVIKAFYGG